jgi:hypothetical protein
LDKKNLKNNNYLFSFTLDIKFSSDKEYIKNEFKEIKIVKNEEKKIEKIENEKKIEKIPKELTETEKVIVKVKQKV